MGHDRQWSMILGTSAAEISYCSLDEMCLGSNLYVDLIPDMTRQYIFCLDILSSFYEMTIYPGSYFTQGSHRLFLVSSQYNPLLVLQRRKVNRLS